MKLLIIFILSFLLSASPSSATPDFLGVQQGTANVQITGTETLVQQTTPQAILDWNSIDLFPNEVLKFVQPSTTSLAINRVLGNTGASFIAGRIEANGRVALLNSNGIIFTPDAQIKTLDFLAATENLDLFSLQTNPQFLNFSSTSTPFTYIVLDGEWNIATGGNIILLSDYIQLGGNIAGYKNNLTAATMQSAVIDLSNGMNLLALTLSAGEIALIQKDLNLNHGSANLYAGNRIVFDDAKLNTGTGNIDIAASNIIDLNRSFVLNNKGKIDVRGVSSNPPLRIQNSAIASKNGEINIQTQNIQNSNSCIEAGANPCAAIVNASEFREDLIAPVLISNFLKTQKSKKISEIIKPIASASSQISENNFIILDEESEFEEDE